MDIETFSQCLQYIKSTNSASPIKEFIPLMTATAGVIGGFLLNHYSAGSKEKKLASNKLMCCKEDIQRIQEALEDLIRESFCTMKFVVIKETITAHNFPDSVSSLCLDEYFTDIAHKYNKDQRCWIQLILQNIKTINDKLANITNPKSIKNTHRYSLELLNMTNSSVLVWGLCSSVLENKNVEPETTELAKSLGCTADQIVYWNLLVRNAENKNDTLNL